MIWSTRRNTDHPGGLSYLSDLYGLACDNVVNYEVNAQFNLDTIGLVLTRDQVVLANGSMVNANSTFNPDLWWALKGGGNNFGTDSSFETVLKVANSSVRGRDSVQLVDTSNP